MSQNGSNKNSSHSSSGNSPNQGILLFQDDPNTKKDFTLVGSPAPVSLQRTGTVKRVIKESSVAKDDDGSPKALEKPQSPNLESFSDRIKKLDNQYRRSLESINENRQKASFTPPQYYSKMESSSLESSSSDYTDYAMKSTTGTPRGDKTMSPGSSYLSWIESVHSEYFSGSTTTTNIPEADNKVGEWNNFWLNYQCSRSAYLQSPYQTLSNEEYYRNGDDGSDDKSSCSTHKELTDRNSNEQIVMSMADIQEIINCSQRIVEVLQNAIKKNDMEFDDSKNDSTYSQSFSQVTSAKEETPLGPRERSFSYAVDSQELQRQKQMLRPTQQSSSTSCINALLNTGVADMLKRVIAKRRDVMAPSDDSTSASGHRSSFSDWSTK